MLILALVAALAVQAPATTTCPTGTAGAVCRALAATNAGRFAEAATAFEEVAGAAQGAARDRALAAAGNMWIAAGEPGKAALALDRALAGGGLQADQRGEALLDRARAAEAQNDLATARARLDEAAASAGETGFYWYFAAALAIREGDTAKARSAIDRALAIAPSDPLVVFEAGHVANAEGNAAAARAYWTRAAQLDPDGAAGKAAREALALLDSPQPAQPPR